MPNYVITVRVRTGELASSPSVPAPTAWASSGSYYFTANADGQIIIPKNHPFVIQTSNNGYRDYVSIGAVGAETIEMTSWVFFQNNFPPLAPSYANEIIGQVLGGPGIDPISTASVSFRGRFATTDSRGRFLIPNPTIGTGTIQVSKTGYTTQSRSIDYQGGVHVVNFNLGGDNPNPPPPPPPEPEPEPTTNEIFGKVTAGPLNNPLDGVSVKWLAREATTNATGLYKFTDAPTGSGLITFDKLGFQQGKASLSYTGGRRELNISLEQLEEPTGEKGTVVNFDVSLLAQSNLESAQSIVSAMHSLEPEDPDLVAFREYLRAEGVTESDESLARTLYRTLAELLERDDIPLSEIDRSTSEGREQYDEELNKKLMRVLPVGAVGKAPAFLKGIKALLVKKGIMGKGGIQTALLGGSVAAAGTSKLSLVKTATEKTLWFMGLALFADFICEEAVQMAGFGVFIANQSDDIAIYESALNNYKKVYNIARKIKESPLTYNPLTEGAFTAFFDGAAASIEVYDQKLTKMKAEEGTKTKFTLAQITKYFKENHINETRARALLANRGYIKDDIDTYLRVWKSELLDGYKDLTKSEVERLRLAGLITDTEYLAYLSDLGYKSTEASLMLELLKSKLATKVKELTESKLAKAYANGLISRQGFKTELQKAGYSAQNAEMLIQIREASADLSAERIRELSKADILGLFKKEALTSKEALDRLLELGYSEADAKLLLGLE